MKIKFGKAILFGIVAYFIVTVLCDSLTAAVRVIYQLPSAQELGVSIFKDPGFILTIPYWLLINLLIWLIFSYLYFRKVLKNKESMIREAISLGFLWTILSIIIDLVAFVLIKSPISLTAHQFYIEFQPWLSMIYFIVLISPSLYYLFFKFRLRTLSKS